MPIVFGGIIRARFGVKAQDSSDLRGGFCNPAGMLLGSCGSVSEVEKSSRDQAEAVSQELAKLLGKGEPRWSSIRVSERPWLGIEPVQSDERENLPTELEGADAVTLPLSDIESDEVLASRIEAAAKLEVRLLGRASGESGGAGFVGGLSDGWTPSAGIWTGPLGRLLDAWSAAGGYEWRYLDGRVEVVRRKTVTFGINALAGSQNYSAQTATRDRASGEGAAGSARQALSTRAEFNPWPEIRGQLEQLVGADSELGVSAASATVTVTGTPAVIGRVRGYLAHLSRVVLRPLTISAHVYVVRLQREADYEVGIAALIDRIFGERLQIEIGTGSIAVVRPPEGAAADTDTFSATLRALQSVGDDFARAVRGRAEPEREAGAVLRAPEDRVSQGNQHQDHRDGQRDHAEAGRGELGVWALLHRQDNRAGRGPGASRRVAARPADLRGVRNQPGADPAAGLCGPGRSGDATAAAGRDADRGRVLGPCGGPRTKGGTFDEKVPLPDGHRRASGFRQEQVLLLTAEVGEPLGVSETSETEL